MPVLGTVRASASPAPPALVTTGAGANAYIDTGNYAWWVGATPGASMPVTGAGAVDTVALTRAILTATRLIDSFFDWTGSRATDGQSLEWPRVDVDGAPADSVPVEIRIATCAEVAYLTGESAPAWYSGAADARQPVSVRAGPVALSYDADEPAAVQPVSRAVIEAIPAAWYRGGATGVAIVQGVQV